MELTRYQLVIWTAGNVSARVPGRNLMVIKPSGVSYDELEPDAIVVTDLDGNLLHGERQPSSDTAAHAYVYRHMAEVGGVVHTHSTYACAWAARGEPIPCVLTMIADEFGGDIPVGPFAIIGDDSIGRGIVETLQSSRSARSSCRTTAFHRRQDARRGQGCRHAGRRRQDGAHRLSARRTDTHRATSRRPALRPVSERLRPGGGTSVVGESE